MHLADHGGAQAALTKDDTRVSAARD